MNTYERNRSGALPSEAPMLPSNSQQATARQYLATAAFHDKMARRQRERVIA